MPGSALDDLGFGDGSAEIGAPAPKSATPHLGSGTGYVSASDIAAAAQAAGVDPDLYARVIRQESGGQIAALSKKGAIGPAQIMPKTAQALGIDPADPIQNIQGGARYLRQLLDRYGGDQPRALAAYNAGPEAVDAAGGIPDIPETQNYVRSILGGAQAPSASALDDLGFNNSGVGAATKTPPPPASAPSTVANVPVLDRVAADIAQAKLSAAQSGGAQWPIYDEANNVYRNKDGSIAAIGQTTAPTRGPNGELQLNITSSSNPDAILAWQRAHPLDPSNVGQRQPYGAAPQASSVGRAGVGAEQGLANVANSIGGAELALKQNPLTNAMLMGMAPSTAAFSPEQLQARLAQGVLNRNANDIALGQSGAYNLGKFGGEVAGTIPLMAATEGLGGAGLEAFAPDFAGSLATASTGNKLLQLPERFAGSVLRGAGYGGEAGALTSAGSSAPLPEQIQQGAAAGAVLNPFLGGVAGAGKGVAKAVTPLLEPLTEGGRADVLSRNLMAYSGGEPLKADLTEYVPGSRPTLAQATQDPNLAVVERTLKSGQETNHPFTSLQTANENAREDYLSALQSDPDTVERMRTARDAATSQMREAAFAGKSPTDATPVVQTIDTILASPAGQRDAVKRALTNVRGKLVQDINIGNGKTVSQVESDPEQLYGIRQAINDQLSPLAARTGSDAQLASKELSQVKGALDASIEQGAPGFRGYIQAYNQASRPIDALEYLQSLNMRNAKGDLTLGGVNKAVMRMEADLAQPGVNPAKSLAPEQVQALYNLRADMRRADLAGPLAKAARNPNVTGNLDNKGFVSQLLNPYATAALGVVAHHPVGAAALTAGRLAAGAAKGRLNNMLVDALVNPDVTKVPLNVAPQGVNPGAPGWRNLFLAPVGIGAGHSVVHRNNKLLTGTAPAGAQ